MGIETKIDVSRFVLALRSYRAATKKDGAEVLNRAARNIAYRTASFTPKASKAAIRSQLFKDPHLRYALTSLALKRIGGKTLTKNQIKYNPLNKLAQTKGLLGKGEFQKAVDAFVARRMSSAAYLRAAYAEAVTQLGGTFKGARFKGASGFANKATVSKLVAEIVGIVSEPDQAHATSAEKIGLKAVQEAINFVSEDMINYAKTLMAKTAAAHSG